MEPLEDAVVETRSKSHAKLLRDDSQALSCATENALNRRAASRYLRAQLIELAPRLARHRQQRIDVEPISDIGRNSPRRSVGMIEQTFFLEVAHGVRNGCRGHAKAKPAGDRIGSRRLGGLDIRLDHCLENL